MKELIESLRRKDENALRRVLEMYQNQVCNYLTYLLSDRARAEELTQETFVRVYFKAHGLKSDNLKSWIFTIATNLARSEARKKSFRRLLALSEVNPAELACRPRNEQQLMLENTLAAVPEKYRTALLLRLVDDFSFAEIAEMLNKPVGTVKTLVFRGKACLQQNCVAGRGGGNGKNT